jgi:cytochrome c biogenesis protein CcmG/thiol:disulfide interchange protein DsbE
MKKRKRVVRRSKPNSNIQAMLIMGTGLILLGVAAFIAWPRGATPSDASASSGSSTVPAAVSYAAPDLVLSDLDGVQHALADYHGQVVLVNLWATWCPPCKAEMPTLEAYYQDHQADRFVVFAVDDGDPADAVSAFVEQYNLSFPVLLDPTYQASDHAFKTRNLPSSFVIDRDGNVRLRWVGGIDRATLEKYVTPLIAQ